MKSRNIFIESFRSIFDCKTNQEIYSQPNKPLFIEKKSLPEEYEWDRVKRIRKKKEASYV